MRRVGVVSELGPGYDEEWETQEEVLSTHENWTGVSGVSGKP